MTALTRGGCILIALLAGGDYDQSGVVGIGPQIACGLARCGYGDRLMEVAKQRDAKGLRESIKTWHKDVCSELASDSRGILGRSYARLAARVPTSFPSCKILQLYVNPITSWSSASPPDSSAWRPREPTVCNITSFAIRCLGWTSGEELLKRFHANLWSGVCFRMFCMVSSKKCCKQSVQ